MAGGSPYLVVGHSAGGYYAQAMAARHPLQVAGLALVCPLLPGTRDVPAHQVVEGSGDLGDEDFRSYFVVQTPAMLERYEQHVAPAAALVDWPALERIGERWELRPGSGVRRPDPGRGRAARLDRGHAAALELVDQHPHASVVVVDGAGHALPHENRTSCGPSSPSGSSGSATRRPEVDDPAPLAPTAEPSIKPVVVSSNSVGGLS